MANHCVQFKDGKLFTCTFPAHVQHFNKKYGNHFEVCEFDFIDIYKAKDYQEILFFFLSLFLFVDIARYHNGQKLENGVLAIKQNMNI